MDPRHPTPDLWTRFAKLDRCCTVTFMSTFEGDLRTGWQVKLTRQDSDAARPIVTRGATLSEAMEDALHLADAMGWLSD